MRVTVKRQLITKSNRFSEAVYFYHSFKFDTDSVLFYRTWSNSSNFLVLSHSRPTQFLFVCVIVSWLLCPVLFLFSFISSIVSPLSLSKGCHWFWNGKPFWKHILSLNSNWIEYAFTHTSISLFMSFKTQFMYVFSSHLVLFGIYLCIRWKYRMKLPCKIFFPFHLQNPKYKISLFIM